MDIPRESLALVGHRVLKSSFRAISGTANLEAGSRFRSQVSLQSLENEVTKFKLWAGNIGLLDRGHSSLDYRLRDAQLVEDFCRKLLEQLDGALSNIFDIVTGNRIPFDEVIPAATASGEIDRETSESGDESESSVDSTDAADYIRQTELQVHLGICKDIIHRLFKLVTQIRSPVSRFASTKAAQFRKIDKDTDVDLFVAFPPFDRNFVEELISACNQNELLQSNPNHYLVDRLVKANTLRRQQFAYWQRRAEKRSRFNVEPLFEPPPVQEAVKSNEQEINVAQDILESRTVKSTIFSAPTTATQFEQHEVNLDDTQSYFSASSADTTASISNGDKVELPEPPEHLLLEGGRHFECPYCYTICPRYYLKEKNWRTHLFRDLRPYICTYETCSLPRQLYDTRSSWSSHEREHLQKTWYCSDHRLRFSQSTLFEEHLLQQHSRTCHSENVKDFVSQAEIASPASVRPCPFCDQTFENVSQMEIHLAYHLERVAAFALPRSTQLDQDFEDIVVYSRDGLRIVPEGSLVPLVSASSSSTKPASTIDFQDSGPNEKEDERLNAYNEQVRRELMESRIDGEASIKYLNQRQKDPVYALPAACMQGNESIVKLLIDTGADVNATGSDLGTALQAATLEGHDSIVELLLKNGADINAPIGQYGNALQAAAAEGHDSIAVLFLKNGADVNVQGGKYGNALQAASAEGHESLVDLLIENGANINADGGPYGHALQAASARGHWSIVKALIEKGADVNARGGKFGNSLQAASVKSHESIVKLLIKSGANVNAQGGIYGNALQAASVGGRESIVELLIKNGADVNAQGGKYKNALRAAVEKSNARAFEVLLQAGADVNSSAGTEGSPLQSAVLNRNEDLVRRLIAAGADVNAQGGYYGNPLSAALITGNNKISNMLLDAGANANGRGGYYGSCLQAAVKSSDEATIRRMIHAGADVNAQGGGNHNALRAAISVERDDIVQILLDAGAYRDDGQPKITEFDPSVASNSERYQ